MGAISCRLSLVIAESQESTFGLDLLSPLLPSHPTRHVCSFVHPAQSREARATEWPGWNQVGHVATRGLNEAPQ